MRITGALPSLNPWADAGLYGLRRDGAPFMDTPASMVGSWSLEEPLKRWLHGNYALHLVVVPRVADLPVAARGQVEDQATIPPGSCLVALSGASDQTAGFRFTVYDVGAKRFVLSDQWDELATGAQDTTDVESQGLVLPTPYLILAPGLLQVRVANLATVAADMQLLLHFATPGGVR